MRYAMLLFALMLFTTGCYTSGLGQERGPERLSAPESETDQVTEDLADRDNPCRDSLYVALQDKNLAEMSSREYGYFQRKGEQCDAYRVALMRAGAEKQRAGAEGAKAEAVNRYTNFLVFSGMAGTLATIIILARY